MNSYEFNALSNKDKLLQVLKHVPGDPEYDMDTIDLLADTLEYLSYFENENSIKLVQFLNEDDRARGCRWCGG